MPGLCAGNANRAQTRVTNDRMEYYGLTMNHASRTMMSGHGGHVLLHESTRRAIQERAVCNGSTIFFADRGMHCMKGISKEGQIYQVPPPAPLSKVHEYGCRRGEKNPADMGLPRLLSEIRHGQINSGIMANVLIGCMHHQFEAFVTSSYLYALIYRCMGLCNLYTLSCTR